MFREKDMIYITGATGHIGNNLVKKLAEKKIKFKILARSLSKSIEEFKDITMIGDIFDQNFLDENLESNAIFIHLAAFVNLKNNQSDLTYHVNYEGTKIIADTCVKKNIKLIYISSVDAIHSQEYLIKEPKYLEPDTLATLYQKTKAIATNYLIDLTDQGLLSSLILYPSAVIGINDYKPSPIGKEIKKCLKKRLCLYFQGGYNFIDVDDVTEAIIKGVIDNVKGQVILSGQYVSLFRMYRLIFETNRRKVLMIKIPVYLVKLVSKIIPRYKVMIKALLSNHNYDNSLMISKLNIQPKPISSTIKNTVTWFLEETNR